MRKLNKRFSGSTSIWFKRREAKAACTSAVWKSSGSGIKNRNASSQGPPEDGTPILRYRFTYMSMLEIAIHVEALVVAAFGILVSLSGIASFWAFRKIARLAG